jgi:predicted Zn-dependent protease
MSVDPRTFLSAFLAIVFTFACATSPTGRKQLLALPDSQMNAMGAQSFDELKKKIPRESLPSTNTYVRCVADALLRQTHDSTGVRDWEVVVFRDPSANAFALPGGKIGVHTGLLEVASTPGQLAAVLGHEIAHVTARHGNERVSQSVATQGGLALVSAVLSGKDSSSENQKKRAMLFAGLGLGLQFGVLLPFSRSHESEADLLGQDLMSRAGFNPEESLELWRNMAKASRGHRDPQFLSTHPSNETRIQDLASHLAHSRPLYLRALESGVRPACSPSKELR